MKIDFFLIKEECYQLLKVIDMWSDECKRRKEALKTLLDYSSDETIYDPNSSVRTADGQSRLIFGNNSFVSFVRGMKHSFDDMMSARTRSTPINSTNKGRLFSELPCPESHNLSDSEFFDSETGKQLILKDHASHERLMQKTDCTGCSSWTPCSRKNVSSIPIEYSKFKQKECVSVGEFIGVFSEAVTFTDNQKKTNPFLNCLTSTPNVKRKSLSLSSLLDINYKELPNTPFLNFNLKGKESFCMATPTSVKPLKCSTPKWTENSNNQPYSTTRKNIQRLRKEEKLLRGAEVLSSNSLEADKTLPMQSNNSDATGSDTITYALRNGPSALMSGISNQRCNEQWFVEPKLVLLDSNKGNRVRLINNSNKILRFKTTFDSRIINICPLSGTVPAMDQIGLRIILSQYAKKKIGNFEGDVKVIIGKIEKSIHVKFTKEGKSKSSRERSYILF